MSKQELRRIRRCTCNGEAERAVAANCTASHDSCTCVTVCSASFNSSEPQLQLVTQNGVFDKLQLRGKKIYELAGIRISILVQPSESEGRLHKTWPREFWQQPALRSPVCRNGLQYGAAARSPLDPTRADLQPTVLHQLSARQQMLHRICTDQHFSETKTIFKFIQIHI